MADDEAHQAPVQGNREQPGRGAGPGTDAWILESLDRVDHVIRGAQDLEQMMRDVLDELLSIFDAQRAWLLYPCNPTASTWRPRMERTRPGYPAIVVPAGGIPTDPERAELARIFLDAPGPVTFMPGGDHPLSGGFVSMYQIRSYVAMALRPRSGDAWAFGLHECVRDRAWTAPELRLFEAVGRRVSDSLSNLIAVRDLQKAEERLRLALAAGTIGALDIDLETGEGTWTTEAAAISGIPVDYAGNHLEAWLARIHPDDARAMEADLRGARVTDTDQAIDYRMVRSDGSVRWVRWRGRITADPETGGRRGVGVVVDVTEMKTAEERLRASELRYRALMEQASDAILVADADRRYVEVNLAACEMLGYTREELLALTVADVTPPELNPGQDARWRRMLAGETLLSERTLRRKDGTILTAELNARKLADGRLQAIARDITDRKRLEADQARLVAAVEQAGEAIVITDAWATILYVNPAFERVSGYTRVELVGENPRVLSSGAQDTAFYRDLWATIRAGHTWRGTFVNRTKGGDLYEEDAVISPIHDPDGRIVAFVGVKHDVTRQHALEEQLRQTQKMQAIGQLAGGIAHDFNNLITAIRGYGELARDSLPAGAPERDDLEQVLLAANRAADLTRQLLAFGRRQVLRERVVEPAEIVEGIAPMLRRLIGENITLETTSTLRAGHIRADRTQVEQVILNLVVNARDAIPERGTIRVETSAGELGPSLLHPGAEPDPEPAAAARPAVVLRVTDTGTGMDAATQARIFEPFFTTKAPGRGTGMGLATVYGIVQQSGGAIRVISEPDRGTAFEIAFPLVDASAADAVDPPLRSEVPNGSETILVVEDEPGVREFTRRALEGFGYHVITAQDGAEALALLGSHAGPLDLLLTDVVMPRLGGFELAERAREQHPDLRVLVMSGFPADDLRAGPVEDAGWTLIGKPFSGAELALAIRDALADPAS